MTENRNAGPATTAIVGLQWGDEGKGKIIDLLGAEYDAIVRYNGGANAGHSVVVDGVRYALHLMPSGILHPGKLAVVGNGVVLDPEVLLGEMQGLEERGVDISGLRISDRAHVVLPWHKLEDAQRETLLAEAAGETSSIGTTRRGIGPAYADKAHRSTAIRVGDICDEARLDARLGRMLALKSRSLEALGTAESIDEAALRAQLLDLGARLHPYVTDTTYLLHDLLREGRSLLFEGANATLLDVDHGTFPYITSSNASVLGIPTGTGVSPKHLGTIVGVCKAYQTRVGAGPFPTESFDASGERIRERGREYGTTTGRPRRCGWLDLVALRYAAMVNGIDTLSVMLLDVLAGFDEMRECEAYEIDGERTDRFQPDSYVLERAKPVYRSLPGFASEINTARSLSDLPSEARGYLDAIEEGVGVPIGVVSIGPDREETIRL